MFARGIFGVILVITAVTSYPVDDKKTSDKITSKPVVTTETNTFPVLPRFPDGDKTPIKEELKNDDDDVDEFDIQLRNDSIDNYDMSTTTEASGLGPIHPTEQLPQTCEENITFTILSTKYKGGKAYNSSRTVTVEKCCEGYIEVGRECRLNLCHNLTCSEDPQSRCVIIKRCGAWFPLLVDRHGIISEVCQQPKGTQNYLCPNDICETGSSCPAHSDGSAICFRNACDCTPSPRPIWLLQNGRNAYCSL